MPESVREWLIRQLARREWKQADLARAMDIPPGTVSRWVRGEQPPSPAMVDRLAEVFATDVNTLMVMAGWLPDAGSDLSEIERDLIAAFRLMDSSGQMEVLNFVQWRRTLEQRREMDRKQEGDT